MKNKCNLFYCDRVKERRCCRSCRRFDRCPNKCLNHPDRCGAAVEEVTGSPKGRITSIN